MNQRTTTSGPTTFNTHFSDGWHHISELSGWQGGSYIGVGTTGLFWENVAGGVYWLGNTGVLYDANVGELDYTEAINSPLASEIADKDFAAMAGEQNDALIKSAAKGLEKRYGMKAEKATAIASALNRWAVAGAERGFTTATDMASTFEAVFGVDAKTALAAAGQYKLGDKKGLRNLVNRFADAAGIRPDQAQQFVKDSYAKALASWGYGDISTVDVLK